MELQKTGNLPVQLNMLIVSILQSNSRLKCQRMKLHSSKLPMNLDICTHYRMKLYAHITSSHPNRQKKKFLKGKLCLRLLRTNLSETTFEENLSACLYLRSVIQTTLSEVSFADRQSALIQKSSPLRNLAFCHFTIYVPTISVLH